MQISPLGEFVFARRKALRMSRDEVSATAKRHGFSMSASYLAKLENGDPGTGRSVEPTIEKLDALAAALNTTRQVLLDVRDGVAQFDGTRIIYKNGESHETPVSPAQPPLSIPGVTTGRELLAGKDQETQKPALQWLKPGAPIKLPVFPVSCGEPVIINDHPEDYETWPSNFVGDVDAIMKVRGDSMLGLGYQEGDSLFVKLLHGQPPRNGDKVVATVNGRSMCKLYKTDDMGAYLEAAPGDGGAWRIPVTAEVRIVAVVVKRMTDA